MVFERRKLERQGLEVPAFGVGCPGTSQSDCEADAAECLATIELALELGARFFDTEKVQGPVVKTRLLGRALPQGVVAGPHYAEERMRTVAR